MKNRKTIMFYGTQEEAIDFALNRLKVMATMEPNNKHTISIRGGDGCHIKLFDHASNFQPTMTAK